MSIRLALSLLLPAAAALAQTPANLIAYTLNGSAIFQGDHATCTQISLCATGQPSTGLFLWQGGIAYDSSRSEVWVSNGNLLGRYNGTTCGATFGPVLCPRTPGFDVCGLDVHDALNQLWIIDNANVITRVTNNNSLTLVTTHLITGLAAGQTPTGISIDELRGLVFYSTTDFSSPTGNGFIYVAPISSPGIPFQSWPVVDCITTTNGRITGLAVDAGNSVIYWTNGRGTFKVSYVYTASPGPTVAFTPGSCCIMLAPLGDPFMDIAIKWGGATSSGAPCASGTCPSCPMVHSLRNAPLLGTTLQLGLDLAPVGVPAWCLINVGSCAGSAGTIPPLCGPVLVPTSAAVTLGFQITTGGGPCTGTTTFLLPLPPNPALAGLPLASQCIALCPPTGVTMSNCLSYVLQ
jgi:hypothetical protein